MKQIYFILLLFFAIASGAVAQTTDIASLTKKAELVMLMHSLNCMKPIARAKEWQRILLKV